MPLSNSKLLLLVAGAMLACSAGATTYTDNFTGGSSSLSWIPLDYACLTAGNGSGSIPACSPAFDKVNGVPGALRLTPAQNYQTGAILSNFTFPKGQGLQVTFTTYTYGSTSTGGGATTDGADGITFFLTDGTQAIPVSPVTGKPVAGATGGAMGYDCSHTNTAGSASFNNLPKDEGLANAYLGLGIDEWGNFLNSGDNGSTGIYNTNNPYVYDSNNPGLGGQPPPNQDGTITYPYGTNTFSKYLYNSPGNSSGSQYQPMRIGLRGRGNTTWAELNSLNSTYYSGTYTASSTQSGMVRDACSRGEYVASVSKKGQKTYLPLPDGNYNVIPGGFTVLPNSEPIADVGATTRTNAWPITYKLTLSAAGLLNFSYSYNNGAFQPVLVNHDITQDNGPVPDLLGFGFSAGTGGDNNVHEITCFQASPLQASSSAAANTTPGGRVIQGTQLYVPGYSTNDWWGSLQAISVETDPSTGGISINNVANWDAKCVLTGGPCDSMGVDANGKPITSVPVQTSRTLLTSDALDSSTGGVTLAWANLNQAQQDALNVPIPNDSIDPTPGPNRVAWLTGDRSREQLASGCTTPPSATQPCDLRARTYVLGDIINSSPAFVGAPNPGQYPDTFTDLLDPTDPNHENSTSGHSTTPYSTYASTNATRENVVYVGSNDGFVHGFRAGSYNGATYDSSTNDGHEVVGYMPYDVLLDKAANLTNPLYTHDYLVDATPGSGDLFYGGTWHTWLVGGVGSSGSEIYALNITDPTSFSPTDVIGDWDNSTLTHLGNTVGTPVIVRMHNGDWAFIFGSGLVSPGTANPPTEGVYVGLVDPSSGAVTFQFLDTGVTPQGVTNADGSTTAGGIAYVTPADLDGDHIADYLYAGDTQGNVFRFDVTSATPADWSGASATNLPITVFQAKIGNVPQPITTSLQLGLVATGVDGTTTRVMIYFGTGQLTQQGNSSAALYATGTQTFYGIWDWNMSAWNAKSSVKYASMSAPQTVTQSDLLEQTVTATTLAVPPNQPATRSLSSSTVCWADQSSCSGSAQYGWYFNMPDPGPTTGANAGTSEQVIYNPTIIGGEIVVNTATPPTVNAAACNPGQQGGWTMAFNPETGGAIPGGFFGHDVSGISQQGVGMPTALQYGGNTYVVTNTGPGLPKINHVFPLAGSTPGRVSWRELVNP